MRLFTCLNLLIEASIAYGEQFELRTLEKTCTAWMPLYFPQVRIRRGLRPDYVAVVVHHYQVIVSGAKERSPQFPSGPDYAKPINMTKDLAVDKVRFIVFPILGDYDYREVEQLVALCHEPFEFLLPLSGNRFVIGEILDYSYYLLHDSPSAYYLMLSNAFKSALISFLNVRAGSRSYVV